MALLATDGTVGYNTSVLPVDAMDAYQVPGGPVMDPTGRMRIQAQHGDTLFKFAQQSLPPGASHSDIMHMVSLIAMQNGLADPNKIQAGQSLSMAHSFNPEQAYRPPQPRISAPPGVAQSPAMSQSPAPGGAPSSQGPRQDYASPIGPDRYGPMTGANAPIIEPYNEPNQPATFSPSSGQPDFMQLSQDVHPLGLPPQGYGAALLAAGAGALAPMAGLGAAGTGMIAGAGQGAARSMFAGQPLGWDTLKGAGVGMLTGGLMGKAAEMGGKYLDARQAARLAAQESTALNARPPITGPTDFGPGARTRMSGGTDFPPSLATQTSPPPSGMQGPASGLGTPRDLGYGSNGPSPDLSAIMRSPGMQNQPVQDLSAIMRSPGMQNQPVNFGSEIPMLDPVEFGQGGPGAQTAYRGLNSPAGLPSSGPLSAPPLPARSPLPRAGAITPPEALTVSGRAPSALPSGPPPGMSSAKGLSLADRLASGLLIPAGALAGAAASSLSERKPPQAPVEAPSKPRARPLPRAKPSTHEVAATAIVVKRPGKKNKRAKSKGTGKLAAESGDVSGRQSIPGGDSKFFRGD